MQEDNIEKAEVVAHLGILGHVPSDVDAALQRLEDHRIVLIRGPLIHFI